VVRGGFSFLTPTTGTTPGSSEVAATAESKIVSCRIVFDPGPSVFGSPPPDVNVTFDDGESKTLFTFYPDELSFTEREFIGLTEREAMQLWLDRDQAYLRS
jgi:hypothetical protein